MSQQDKLKVLVTARNNRLLHNIPPRRQSRNIAGDALIKLIRKEVASGIAGIFGDIPKRNAGGAIPDFGSGGRHGGVYNLPGSGFFGQQPNSGFDQRQMDAAVDQMVASSLMHGRQTSSVLRSLFGIVPSLMGR